MKNLNYCAYFYRVILSCNGFCKHEIIAKSQRTVIKMTIDKPEKFQSFLRSPYLLWVLVLLFSFFLQASGWVDAWRYDRSQVEQGAYWLILSGNLVHLNWSHWGLNIAGLGIVAYFFSGYASTGQWLMVLLVSAMSVGIGISWLNPDIQYYVGLSGVLHGLFIFGALREIRKYPLSGYVLLIVLLAKLIWELVNGALPGSEELTGGRVLTDAHFYGAVAGFLCWSLITLLSRHR